MDPFIQSARNGDLNSVKHHLTQGVDVNLRHTNGSTAIMFAAENGYSDVGEYLFDEGADPSITNEYGSNILHYTANGGCLNLVERLIENGVDLNICNNGGNTALILACSKNHIEIVKLLIKANADLNIRNNNGYTALMFASDYGHIEIVKILIDAGANLKEDKNGWTAKNIAKHNNHSDIVNLLILAEAKQDVDGRTQLIHDIRSRNLNIATQLSMAPIIVNYHDNFGMTPLHYAIQDNNCEYVKTLLSHNGNPFNKNKFGIMPIGFIWSSEMLELLHPWICIYELSKHIPYDICTLIQEYFKPR